jgi:3-oxoadipate enol-lactonase
VASVHANGIDVHYVEAGVGPPLVLIDNGMVSGSSAWDGHPFAFHSALPALAEHFRVVLPDNRGSGETVHPGGPIPQTLLADDVVALIEALALNRPCVCGFSDGGETATLVGIRAPESVRAVVNVGGYDLFNPQAPSIPMTRAMLGGSPDATEASPEALARLAEESEGLRSLFAVMEADHDRAQGPGHWQQVIAQTFDRITEWHGYTFEDLGRITVPTLILIGDRDPFCSVEEGVQAYRALQHGELAVLPNTGHLITPAVVETVIEFVGRQASITA